MGLFGSSKTATNINWINLESEELLSEILKEDTTEPIVIFKHSISCSISSMAKSRLESEWPEGVDAKVYHLDLIAYRAISNKIAEQLNVYHASPQAIVVHKGKAIYNASHGSILADEIISALVSI